MSEVKILQPHEMNRWNHFVASHELGTIYHTSSWRRVIENVYRWQPIYLAIEDDDGNIAAGLPLFSVKSRITGARLSSLPCAQCCDPLVSSREQFDRLIDFVLGLEQNCKARYFELKATVSFPANNGELGTSLDIYSTYVLDIDRPLDDIKGSFHKSCIQRAIDKSYKSNLELVVGRSEDDVKAFYRLYRKMRRAHGLLPQPYSFFLTMWEIMYDEDYIDILHAKYQGKIISSLLLLKYKDTATYEYGATISRMYHLRPSHFLLWEAIKRLKLQGYTKLDLGRTENNNKGLGDFKRRWGAKRRPLRYYYVPEIEGFASTRHKSLTSKIMYRTSKHLPSSLSHLMGALLYRHFV